MDELRLASTGIVSVKRRHDYASDREGKWVLEVLGAPFGGHIEGKDAEGEFFSPRTEFMLDVGDKRPVLYYHGATPHGTAEAMPEVIGEATVTRRDEKGLWFDVVLDKTSNYAERIWEAAINGLARASSGALNYLTRYGPGGEILTWPIGELTLLDQGEGRMPANQLATVNLKSVFEAANLALPQAFVKEGATPSKTSAAQDEEDAEQIYTDSAINRALKLEEAKRWLRKT